VSWADRNFNSPNGMGHCIGAFNPRRLYIDHAEASDRSQRSVRANSAREIIGVAPLLVEAKLNL
jgi:hypothetical protein